MDIIEYAPRNSDELKSSFNSRKKLRTYKEALDLMDECNPIEDASNGSRLMKAASFWTSFLFNIAFIIRNWIIRPERDPSKQFNLSQLIIVWVEFLVISVMLLIVTSLFLYIRYGGKRGIGKYNVFLDWSSLIVRFSTIYAMRFLNPGNLFYYARTWKDNFKQYSILQASKARMRKISAPNAVASCLTNIDTTSGMVLYYLCFSVFFVWCLILGTMSFSVKAKALSFLSEKKPFDWDASETFSFFGFFFQLSNISVHSLDRIITVRYFLFAGVNWNCNEEESERQLIFLRCIHAKLFKKYGFIKGVLYLGATIDERDFHELFVEGIETPTVS